MAWSLYLVMLSPVSPTPKQCCVSCFQPANPPPPPALLFPRGSPTLGIIVLCPRSSFPDALSIPDSSPDGFLHNSPRLSTCLGLCAAHRSLPPPPTPHSSSRPGGGESVLKDSCCLPFIPPSLCLHTGRRGGGGGRGEAGRRIGPPDHP